MKKILIVDKSDGKVASRYESADDVAHQESYGGAWSQPTLFEHIVCPDGINADHVLTVDLTDVADKWTKDGESDASSEPQRDVWTKEGEDDVYVQPTVDVWTKDGESNLYAEPMTQEYWSKDGEDDVFVDPEDETWTNNPSVADVTWVQGTENDIAWSQTLEADPSWTLVAGRTETMTEDVAMNKTAQITTKYAEMNTDVLTQMAAVFGTTNTDSATAYQVTWEKMVSAPSLYSSAGLTARFAAGGLAVGDILDTDQKVQDYANAKVAEVDAYGVTRMQRIEQFRAEKAAIEAS